MANATPVRDTVFDVVIVGAGPAGLSAALNARQRELNYVLLEKTDHIADTIASYTKKKRVMAEPSSIEPLPDRLWFADSDRETVLERWAGAVRDLNIEFNSEVIGVVPPKDGTPCFQVAVVVANNQRQPKVFQAKNVVLSSGTQSEKRKLTDHTGKEVPLTGLTGVRDNVGDADSYADKRIVVVGAGDSAIEYALALCAKNRVTMVIRKPKEQKPFAGVKQANLEKIEAKEKAREIDILYGVPIDAINQDFVKLKPVAPPPQSIEVDYDWLIAALGTEQPIAFLKKCGVPLYGKPERARVSLSYQTEVPGLYLVGAVSGRHNLIKHAINQGFEVIEHISGHPCIPTDLSAALKKMDAIGLFPAPYLADRLDALKSASPLFADTTIDEIAELLVASKFSPYRPGQLVFQEEDHSDSLHVILEGNVHVKKRPDVKAVVATRGKGGYVGEMSLMSGARRSATIEAASDTLLWEIERPAMLKLIKSRPSVDQHVLTTYVVNAFQSYIFPGWPRADLEVLAQHVTIKFFPEKLKDGTLNCAIIRQGDESDDFYFIRAGKVRITQDTPRRKDVHIRYLKAGDFFGEIAVMEKRPRSATVTAIAKVEVLVIKSSDLNNSLQVLPALKQEFERKTAEREATARWSNEEAAFASEVNEAKQSLFKEEPLIVGDNVMLIDESRCIHCDNCVKACESVHEDGQARLYRTGPKVGNLMVAQSCAHCDNPGCMSECDAGDAITRAPSGEVYIDAGKCVNCGKCEKNCPYHFNFKFIENKPKPDTSFWGSLKSYLADSLGAPIAAPVPEIKRPTPIKCDLCRDVAGGYACVNSCPAAAITRKPAEKSRNIVDNRLWQRKNQL